MGQFHCFPPFEMKLLAFIVVIHLNAGKLDGLSDPDGFCRACKFEPDKPQWIVNICNLECRPSRNEGCYDHEGELHQVGTSFFNECNRCYCGVAGGSGRCTRMLCPKGLCYHNGKGYKENETFMKDCNFCVCMGNGRAACTRKECNIPWIRG